LGGLLRDLLADGLTDDIREILSDFLDNHRVQSGVVNEAVGQGDLLRAADAAHSMISAAGGIGAQGLAEACDRLECACRAGDTDSLEAALSAKKVEETPVLEGVRRFLSNDSIER
jgi:HPt (histidine-containing phosphotransfer) domain-containing protein